MNLHEMTTSELRAEIRRRAAKPKRPKMHIVSFRLTMPNVGSWNGQWSGAAKMYYTVRKCATDKFLKTDQTRDSWHYSWGDGWGANVEAEIIDGREAAKRRKISSGFCGYDWMVDNIIDHGNPKHLKDLPTELAGDDYSEYHLNA